MELGFLERGRACCGSMPQDRFFAGLFLPLLAEAKVPEGSLSRFFQLAISHLAAGRNAFDALHRLGIEDFSEEWIELDLPRRRNAVPEKIEYRPLLPNIFRGSPSVAAFLETPWPDMMASVIDELAVAYAGMPEEEQWIAEWREYGATDLPGIIESSLPLRFPPLLIAYTNFNLFNFALPSCIDLDAQVMVSVPTDREDRGDNRWFKEFYEARKRLFDAMKEGEWTEAGKEIEILRERHPTIRHPGSRMLCQVLLYLLEEPVRKRNLKVKELYRIVSEMPRVHRMVQAKARLGRIYGITLKALKIYRAAAEQMGKPINEKLFAKLMIKSKPIPRPFVLVPPAAVRKRYLELGPCPKPPGEEEAGTEEYIRRSAWRIMGNILHEFGARCVSLLGVELRHAVVTEEVIDIIIPFSKGEKQKDYPLPVSWLWPLPEADHLRQFIEWMERTGRYKPRLRLTELAGIGRFDGKDSSEKAYRAISKALCERFGEDESAETHLGRISFASWFPIRCLVAHHRWLLQQPILACCRNDPWFTNEALDRLQWIYPNEAYSVLEVERRILMQSTCKEIAATYCRTFPILATLWSILRLQEEA